MLAAALLFPASHAWAQCEGARSDRLALIGGGYAVGETVLILARHNDWWPDPAGSFHTSWGGSPSANQDGFAHAAVTYQAAQGATLLYDWACVPRVTAGWLGALTGLAFSLPKEIGDGLHAEGFSYSDMLFNGSAALLVGVHRAVPVTNAFNLKVFYFPSAELRNRTGTQPHLESDYAGQRYFLTVSPGLLPGGSGAWPAWLGVGVGHGTPGWVATFPATDDWYVVTDLSWRGLPIKADWWPKVASLLDQVHLPFPGVRHRNGEWKIGLY